ncbi:MAG: cbb3-type cytochrome oxidase assembly protein CcoS [Gemmatimonadaceae bacterium]|nr:cbb3-type cytochrome oxidase assembly protein CcoS [Gemmatimonadaceae bacterium]
MTIIYVVLPLALLIVGVALWAYVWAARSGQFDDLDTPALRVVVDADGDVSPPRPAGRTDARGHAHATPEQP